MKVLVTGATGFVGSHLVDLLLDRGYAVRCLVRKTSNLQWLANKPVELVEGSLQDVQSLEQAVQGIEGVFHIAGVIAARSERGYFEANQKGTRNLLQAVLRYNPTIQRFLHMSSLAAVGPAPSLDQPVTEDTPPHPITAYGRSKAAAEREVLAVQDQLPVTIIRPPAVYGPRDAALVALFQTIVRGIVPLIGLKEKYVSLVHVADLVRGTLLAFESPKAAGEIFFISSERFYTWEEVGTTVIRAAGKRRYFKVKIPHALVLTIAGFSEFLGRFSTKPPVFNLDKGRDFIQPYWICSVDKAKRLLGYRQEVEIDQGVPETLQWYIEQGWITA